MRRAVALWLVLLAAYATTIGLRAGPGRDLDGREAHALLAAESVASDRDLDLRDEYATRAWRSLSGPALRPLAAPHGGRLLEPTGIGFALAIAPAQALGGRIAVELELAALAALGFVLAAALGRRLVPEPWASGAALAVGLSPPALLASTTIAPDALAGTLLAGAAALALRVRVRPSARATLAAGGLLAALPWLALRFLAPGAVVALALYRWPRRRNRAVAGLLGLEALLFSLVLYAALNDRLYGGLTPDAVLPAGVHPTGAAGVLDHLARAPRLLELWVDPRAGLLRWAPVLALALLGLWRLARSRRERLAVALADQADVEVAAGLLALAGAAAVVVAAFLAPTLAGGRAGWPGPALVAVLPLAAALAAWGLRHHPRLGAALAALTVAQSVWLVVAR